MGFVALMQSVVQFFTVDIVSFWHSHLLDYTIALGIIVVFYILRLLFSRYIVTTLLRLSKKTETTFDTKTVEAFRKPVRRFIVFLGIYLAVLYVSPYDLDSVQHLFINRVFRTVIIVLIFSGIYNLVDSSSDLLMKVGRKYEFDRIVLSFFSKVLRVIIIALSIPIIADTWGIDINGFVAGLGIGGLALALAAQDAISNVFGGLVIITEKPFSIGDWILASNVEGTVEDISFRSTKIRTFAQALVTVPNSSLAKQPITNWTRMGRRQISFRLGVTYSTPKDKLEACVQRIRHMLTSHGQVHPQTIFVFFDGFNSSSLDIFIYFFTQTTVWGEFLAVKEEILYNIMEILEEEDVSVAFPSTSVYFENPVPEPAR